MMKSAFSRSMALVAAMQSLLSTGVSYAAAAAQSGAANYKSRGKGCGNRIAVKVRGRLGKAYPFSSTKQHRKAATSQVTVERNGFQFMNTRKAKDRLTMSQVA